MGEKFVGVQKKYIILFNDQLENALSLRQNLRLKMALIQMGVQRCEAGLDDLEIQWEKLLTRSKTMANMAAIGTMLAADAEDQVVPAPDSAGTDTS